MKKALIFIGSFLLLILTVIFVFFFCEHQKNLSGLYSKPSCSPWTPPLYFETKNSYIAWIENPNLGIDEMTDQCECPDANHTIPPGEPIPRSYKYSVRSDEHRMFVVDRMYPLVHFPKNFSSTGQYHEYGMLTHGGMAWNFRDEAGNKYTLSVYTNGRKPYVVTNTSGVPSTKDRLMSREGDPYSIAPDPENYTVRELEEETYYISKPWPNDPNRFTISWFEGNYVASLIVTPKAPFEYDAATMDISRYLSYFEMELVDLPPLNGRPFLWVGIAGVICLGVGVGAFFVGKKVRNSKKPS